MVKDKNPREPIVKGEANDGFSETPMERFRALTKRLARVSKEDLQKEAEKHKKKRG